MKTYIIQSVLFNRNFYNLAEAKKWLSQHGHHFLKCDITKNYLRCRQIDPQKLEREGYKHYYVKPLNNHIQLVIAYKN